VKTGTIALIVGGVALAGGGGYWLWRRSRKNRPQFKDKEAPLPQVLGPEKKPGKPGVSRVAGNIVTEGCQAGTSAAGLGTLGAVGCGIAGGAVGTTVKVVGKIGKGTARVAKKAIKKLKFW
jgi:LPXTG-motif cell wall-anchored protein